jgi:hypothetical protein
MENRLLNILKNVERPEEDGWGSSEEEVVAALGTEAAKGGKELYCFLGEEE